MSPGLLNSGAPTRPPWQQGRSTRGQQHPKALPPHRLRLLPAPRSHGFARARRRRGRLGADCPVCCLLGAHAGRPLTPSRRRMGWRRRIGTLSRRWGRRSRMCCRVGCAPASLRACWAAPLPGCPCWAARLLGAREAASEALHAARPVARPARVRRPFLAARKRLWPGWGVLWCRNRKRQDATSTRLPARPPAASPAHSSPRLPRSARPRAPQAARAAPPSTWRRRGACLGRFWMWMTRSPT